MGRYNEPLYQERRRRPGMSALGLAALVCGLIAIVGGIVPICGIFTVPLSIVGIILAVVGFFAAAVSGQKGVGVPLLGGIVCVVSLVLPFLVVGGLLTILGIAAQNAPAPSPTTQPAASSTSPAR